MRIATKSSREDARIGKTRGALQGALIELIGAEPFETLTVTAITQRANVGYATFFRHYPDTQALLAEIAGGLIDELIVAIAPLALAQDSRGIAQVLTAFVEDRRRLCHALLIGAGDAMRREITARALAAARMTEGATPAGLPRDLALIHGVAATMTILAWWLGHEEAEVDMVAILERLVFEPLSQTLR